MTMTNLRSPLLAAALLLLAAAPARPGAAALTASAHGIRGDLRADSGETDLYSFLAAEGTRLDVRLHGSGGGSLAPAVRLLGPDGAVDYPGAGDGETLSLRGIVLGSGGAWRVEVGGQGRGEYEGTLRLRPPRMVVRNIVLAGPSAEADVAIFLPAGARLAAADLRGDAEFTGLVGPDDDPRPGQARRRGLRSRVRFATAEGPGTFLLGLVGNGPVSVTFRLSMARTTGALLDLADGTDPLPAGGPAPSRTGQTLVRLAGGTTVDEFLARHGCDVVRAIPGTGYLLVGTPAGKGDDEFVEDMKKDHDVLFAERNLLSETPEGGQSSLPVLDDNLDDSAVVAQVSFARIGLTAAWPLATGAGVVVAVVDTGVDTMHPALIGRLAPGGLDFIGGDADPRDERNGLDDDGDFLVDEGYGHGTFVAGLVLAVAPGALVLPMRVLDSDARGDAAAIAEAVVRSVDLGARVVNLSLGSPQPSEAIREAIRYAENRGVTVVVAAGNEADLVLFPARFSNTLAVTAVDAAGIAAPFTNFGSPADLAAPGVDLAGPVPADLGTAYARWSGTSFAAPLVSGTLALVRQARPFLAADRVVRALLDSAEDITDLNPAIDLGEGLLRPDLALR